MKIALADLIALCAAKYAKLPESAMDMLVYLVHNKDHVFRKGHKDEDMEVALKLCGEKRNTPLYRGVSNVELEAMLAGEPINYYTSFSEDKQAAQSFGTNVVTLKSAPLAFNYMAFSLWQLDQIDQEEYEDIDGDFLKETLEQEREWILPFNSRYEVVDRKKLVFRIGK